MRWKRLLPLSRKYVQYVNSLGLCTINRLDVTTAGPANQKNKRIRLLLWSKVFGFSTLPLCRFVRHAAMSFCWNGRMPDKRINIFWWPPNFSFQFIYLIFFFYSCPLFGYCHWGQWDYGWTNGEMWQDRSTLNEQHNFVYSVVWNGSAATLIIILRSINFYDTRYQKSMTKA